MNETIVKKIQAVLNNGDRVLIVPVKNGVRLFVVKREEIKI